MAKEIVDGGGRAIAAVFDVTDYDAVKGALARIEEELGPVDILVNNAGIPEGRHTGPFVESSPPDWMLITGSKACA